MLLIGAGGLGGHIAGPLVRKGVGILDIFDGDIVEVSNLNRQKFYLEDIFESKALSLAKNAAREGHSKNIIRGHFIDFSKVVASELRQTPDVVVCAVDNNLTRQFVSRFFRRRNIPVVFTATSEQSDYGGVFVQEATGACIGCLFPRMTAASSERHVCKPVPAVINILSVLGGIVLHAIDHVLMTSTLDWNFYSVHLNGMTPGIIDHVAPKSGCNNCWAMMDRDNAS